MAWEREREAFRRQESPGVLFFRVAVMLSCLILLPLAAILGSAFPNLVKSQIIERITSLAGLQSYPGQTPPSAFADGTAPSPERAVEAPRWNNVQRAPAWQPAVSPMAAHQVDYTTNMPEPPPHAVEPIPQTADHFTDIQQRLRSYGANHYALESFGNGGELYRFQCTFPSPGWNSTTNFQATDRDPLVAMANVLKQVEALRQQRANWREDPSSGLGR